MGNTGCVRTAGVTQGVSGQHRYVRTAWAYRVCQDGMGNTGCFRTEWVTHGKPRQHGYTLYRGVSAQHGYTGCVRSQDNMGH